MSTWYALCQPCGYYVNLMVLCQYTPKNIMSTMYGLCQHLDIGTPKTCTGLCQLAYNAHLLCQSMVYYVKLGTCYVNLLCQPHLKTLCQPDAKPQLDYVKLTYNATMLCQPTPENIMSTRCVLCQYNTKTPLDYVKLTYNPNTLCQSVVYYVNHIIYHYYVNTLYVHVMSSV